MDSKQIARYLAQTGDRRVNTDDNAYLEYHAPFEFLEPTAKIVAELIRFSGWDIDGLLLNAGSDAKENIRRNFSARLDEISDELSKPIR